MRFEFIDSVRVTIPRAALAAICDECDRYDHDETGGRVIGTYAYEHEQLVVHVEGVIGPGPSAQRTGTSFFQDGEYQEHVFRQVEQSHPKVEHLGNWHTHHVNGFPTLSGGDIATYQRTVNHPQHNTTFFYALLVVAKRGGSHLHERYAVKHYLLRRDDDKVYEIPCTRIELTDERLLWPEQEEMTRSTETKRNGPSTARPERIYDRDILGEFYQGLRPYSSERLGLYWRGPLELIDSSHVEVLVLEHDRTGKVAYTIALRKPPDHLEGAVAAIADREFPSAGAAVIALERLCNRLLFEHLAHNAKRTKGR